MRNTPSFHPRVVAASLAAAASGVQAQSCIWTYHATDPNFGPSNGAVYHSGLQRVLFLEMVGVPETRTWAWDGAAWTMLDSNGPGQRWDSAAAYDAARDRVVLFGGYNGGHLADTWEWDRTMWVHIAAPGPPARDQHAMAYDQSRHRTVLFGGGSGTGVALGDTWEWDGQAWTLVGNSGPSPRWDALLAYDSVRARSVLYGGYSTSGVYSSDLWEWDGAVWVQRTSVVPGPWAVWMVFDPGRARMILGRYSNTGQRETWELDGATAVWSPRAAGFWPAGFAAFDIARSRAVVVGSGATLEYDGYGTAEPPSITQQPISGSYTAGAAVTLTVHANGPPASFQWRRAGQPLSNGGNVSGVTTDTLAINPVGMVDAGFYDVVVSNSCATITSDTAHVVVVPACYANCDNSTTPPFLNVNDFVCFLNRFAAGDPWANCDHGYTQPPLNVLDFSCFLNMFAAGCSVP